MPAPLPVVAGRWLPMETGGCGGGGLVLAAVASAVRRLLAADMWLRNMSDIWSWSCCTSSSAACAPWWRKMTGTVRCQGSGGGDEYVPSVLTRACARAFALACIYSVMGNAGLVTRTWTINSAVWMDRFSSRILFKSLLENCLRIALRIDPASVSHLHKNPGT